MAQININTGSVANDGTGDTIRNAFIAANSNFTELYSNMTSTSGADATQNNTIARAFATANSGYDKANSANLLAYNVSVSANLYAAFVGTSGNAAISSVGLSGNTWANTVSGYSNTWANTVGTAGNNYASILAANNATSSNNWANTIGVSTNNWANIAFTTVSNAAQIYQTSNAAFLKANNALPNTTVTLAGNFTATGSIIDGIGPVRESYTTVVNSNVYVLSTQSVIIANNANSIYINVVDDNQFLLTPNVGTTVDIYQLGSGNTCIKPNSSAVSINSSNNWANIAGQYLTASLIKVRANTWILTGNLKA